MSTLKVNSIEANTGSEIDINSTLGTIPSIIISGVTTVAAGSTAAPSITPTGDSDTGIFFPSADTVAIGEGGVERVRIDSSGRVGMGTDNPDQLLTLQTGGDAQISFKNTSGVSKAYVGTSGAFGSASTDDLRIRSDSSNIIFGFNGTERMRISNAGGVFTNDATGPVTGNGNDGIHVGTLGVHLGSNSVTIGDALATARWRLQTGNSRLNFSQNNGSGTYNIRSYVNDTTGAYVVVSDERAKKEVADSIYGIADLKKLRPVSYLMNSQDEDSARRNLGFIAQEVFEVIPEAVNKPEDEQQMYGLESIALIPVLVSSLQEAIAKIESLEARLSALEAQ